MQNLDKYCNSIHTRLLGLMGLSALQQHYVQRTRILAHALLEKKKRILDGSYHTAQQSNKVLQSWAILFICHKIQLSVSQMFPVNSREANI